MRPADADQVRDIQLAQFEKWGESATPVDLDARDNLALFVYEENGKVIAIAGAQLRALAWVSLQPGAKSVREWRPIIQQLAVKVCATLYRGGFDFALAATSKHMKKWGNWIEKRIGFSRDELQYYRFNIKQEIDRAKDSDSF